MKRTAAFILVVCLLVTALPAGFAAGVPSGDIQDILSLMGIMTRDAGGDFRASQNLTRAQLAKILVTVSTYKGLVSAASKTSPFSDVPYTHWSASYVRVAAVKGMMVGYTDGTFRPDRNVLYEEAVTALLNLLGYTNSDFVGGYPFGQLSAAADIGLLEGVNAAPGQAVNRGQAAQLIYNALCADVKDAGKTLAETLGYTMTNGILTLGDAMSQNVQGPLTVTPSTNLAGLGLRPDTARVYIDESVGTASQIAPYDVIYYNVTGNLIWVYSDRTSGIVEDVQPNREAPATIVVSGTTYTLSSYAAQKAFGYGGLETGQLATLLLDRNGDVADAYRTEDIYSEQVGVVVSSGTKEIVSAGQLGISYYVTVLLASGDTFDLATDNDSSSYVGHAVRISYNSTGATVTRISSSENAYGSVSAVSHAIGSGSGRIGLSKDVKFIEFDEYGNTVVLNLSRLDGVVLQRGDISYLSYNASGTVDTVVLNGVTGDTAKFGTVTSVTESSDTMKQTGSYRFYVGSQTGSLNLSNSTLNISTGPSMFCYEDGSVKKIKNLTQLKKTVASVNAAYLMAGDGQQYRLSSSVAVYRVIDNEPVPATLDDAMNDPAGVTAYYDEAQASGGLIRVLYVR